MKHAMSRRIALRRPSLAELRSLQERAFALEALASPTADERLELQALQEEIEALLRRQRIVPYVDTMDVRYRRFEQRPEPVSSAVMVCLMDVSASMGEREKDLAKRFFVLLNLFLRRQYERVELVFIRHTHTAKEVDEETFFHSRETGGTVVSTSLVKMKEIVNERYPVSDWNIYVAQASDGDNARGDSPLCTELLCDTLLACIQYFAYIEILGKDENAFLTDENSGAELWQAYREVAIRWPNFAMKRVGERADIFPVFRELFEKQPA